MRPSTESSNQATYSLIRANLCKLPFCGTRSTSIAVPRLLLPVQLTRCSTVHFEEGDRHAPRREPRQGSAGFAAGLLIVALKSLSRLKTYTLSDRYTREPQEHPLIP